MYFRNILWLLIIVIIFTLGGVSTLVAQEKSHVQLAQTYFFQRDYENATREYELAIDEDPNNATLHYNLGFCYEKMSDHDAAINQYRETLRVDPNHENAKNGVNRLTNLVENPAFNRANRAFFEKKYDEAVEAYRQIIEIDPDNYKANYNVNH